MNYETSLTASEDYIDINGEAPKRSKLRWILAALVLLGVAAAGLLFHCRSGCG